ncbi:MAG: hypothetical protein Q9163_006269 [Psora crenata]
MPTRTCLPSVPPQFAAKKTAILASLAIPDADASPKGSVDAAIKPLIDRINSLEGLVTTSSCSGRVSVFLEGKKRSGDGSAAKRDGKDGQEAEHEVEEGYAGEVDMGKVEQGQTKEAVPGGKGNGGRWLFVSHEPVQLKEEDVLAAAINAGFRESGVQSLKNLDDVNAFPMVAVRSSGLAFESLVGYIAETEGEEEMISSLVSTGYLRTLMDIANGRFKANAERMKRLEEELLKGGKQTISREDTKSRKARKMAEGLARQAAAQGNQNDRYAYEEDDALLSSLGSEPG